MYYPLVFVFGDTVLDPFAADTNRGCEVSVSKTVISSSDRQLSAITRRFENVEFDAIFSSISLIWRHFRTRDPKFLGFPRIFLNNGTKK